MGKVFIRRISILGLCLIALYIGMLIHMKFGNDSFWICIPLIILWLGIYDLVTNKYNEGIKSNGKKKANSNWR